MKSPLCSADNVDVMKTMLTGSGTYHGLAMIFSHISSKPFPTDPIQRRKVSNKINDEEFYEVQQSLFKEYWHIWVSKNTGWPLENKFHVFKSWISDSTDISTVMNIVTKSNSYPGKHFIIYRILANYRSAFDKQKQYIHGKTWYWDDRSGIPHTWWSVSCKHSQARLLKNQEDMALIKAFFNERCLFDKNLKDPHVIMNIKTGMIAPQNVNVNEFHRDTYYPVNNRQTPVWCYDQESRSCRADTYIPAKFISKTVQKW